MNFQFYFHKKLHLIFINLVWEATDAPFSFQIFPQKLLIRRRGGHAGTQVVAGIVMGTKTRGGGNPTFWLPDLTSKMLPEAQPDMNFWLLKPEIPGKPGEKADIFVSRTWEIVPDPNPTFVTRAHH